MIWAQLNLYQGLSQQDIAEHWQVSQQRVSTAIRAVRQYYNGRVPFAGFMGSMDEILAGAPDGSGGAMSRSESDLRVPGFDGVPESEWSK